MQQKIDHMETDVELQFLLGMEQKLLAKLERQIEEIKSEEAKKQNSS